MEHFRSGLNSLKRSISPSPEDFSDVEIGKLAGKLESNGSILSLHLDDATELSPAEQLAELRFSLWNMALVLRQKPGYEGVEKVTATSWIVTEHPKLLEMLGFTIDRDSSEAESARERYKNFLNKDSIISPEKVHVEPTYAFMSREDFLNRFSQVPGAKKAA